MSDKSGFLRFKKDLLGISISFFLLFIMSVSLFANVAVDFVHPKYYTNIVEETSDGKRIQLSNNTIYAMVDAKSILRIIFDNEKLFEITKTLEKDDRITIRIEAYVQPKGAEKYPVPVEKYTTVNKSETSEETYPESEGAMPRKVSKVTYEVYYHEKTLQIFDPATGEIMGAVVDTYLDLASLNLKEGDRIFITITEVETQYYLTKVFEIKDFGVKVYTTTPIVFTYRPLKDREVIFTPSAGTTLVLKYSGRKIKWFEDWFHFGINISFLDFDETQAIEVGLGPALTLYKDYLEIGYGFNLSVEDNPGYWYIGFNVIHLPTLLAGEK